MTKEQYEAAIKDIYSYLESQNVVLYKKERNQKGFDQYLAAAKAAGFDIEQKAVINFFTCVYSVGVMMEEEWELEDFATTMAGITVSTKVNELKEQGTAKKLLSVCEGYRMNNNDLSNEYDDIISRVYRGVTLGKEKFVLSDIAAYEEKNPGMTGKEDTLHESGLEEKKIDEEPKQKEEQSEIIAEEDGEKQILKRRENSVEFKQGLSLIKQKLSALKFSPVDSQLYDRFVNSARNAGYNLDDQSLRNALTAGSNAVFWLNKVIEDNNSWISFRENDFHDVIQNNIDEGVTGVLRSIEELNSLLWISTESIKFVKGRRTLLDADKYEELRKIALYANELFEYIYDTSKAELKTWDELQKEDDLRIARENKIKEEQAERNKKYNEEIRRQAKHAEELINKERKQIKKEETIVLPKTKVYEEEVREKPVTTVYTAEKEEVWEKPVTTVYTAEKEEVWEKPVTTVYTTEKEEEQKNLIIDDEGNDLGKDSNNTDSYRFTMPESPKEKRERIERENYEKTLKDVFAWLSAMEIKPVDEENFGKLVSAVEAKGLDTENRAVINIIAAVYSLSVFAKESGVYDDIVSWDEIMSDINTIDPTEGLARQVDRVINTTLMLNDMGAVLDEYQKYFDLIVEIDAKLRECRTYEETYKDNIGIFNGVKKDIHEAELERQENERIIKEKEEEERKAREEKERKEKEERARREEEERKRQEDIKLREAEKKERQKQENKRKLSEDKKRILLENKKRKLEEKKRLEEEKKLREQEELKRKHQEENENTINEEPEGSVTKSVDVRKMKRPVIEKPVTEIKLLSEDDLPKLDAKSENVLGRYTDLMAKNGWTHRLDRGFFNLIIVGIKNPEMLVKEGDIGLKSAISRRNQLHKLYNTTSIKYKISKDNNRRNYMRKFWSVFEGTSLSAIYEEYNKRFIQLDEYSNNEKFKTLFITSAENNGWKKVAAYKDYQANVDSLLQALYDAKFTDEGIYLDPVAELCDEITKVSLGSKDEYGNIYELDPYKIYESLCKIENKLDVIPENLKNKSVSEALLSVQGFKKAFAEKNADSVEKYEKNHPEELEKKNKKPQEEERKHQEEDKKAQEEEDKKSQEEENKRLQEEEERKRLEEKNRKLQEENIIIPQRENEKQDDVVINEKEHSIMPESNDDGNYAVDNINNINNINNTDIIDTSSQKIIKDNENNEVKNDDIPADKKKAIEYAKKYDQFMAVKQSMLEGLKSFKEGIINNGQKDKKLYRNLATMSDEQKTEAFLKDGSVYYRRMAKALEDCIKLLESGECHEGKIYKQFFELENRAIQYQEYNKPLLSPASHEYKTGSGKIRYRIAENFEKCAGMWRMEYSYLNRELLTLSGGGKKYATDEAKGRYAAELKDKYQLETEDMTEEQLKEYSKVSSLRSQFVNKVANDGFKEIIRFYAHYSHNRSADEYLTVVGAPDSIDKKAAWFVFKQEIDKIFAEDVTADEISKIIKSYSPERLKAKISRLKKDKVFKEVCTKNETGAFSKWEDIDLDSRNAAYTIKKTISTETERLSGCFPLDAHLVNDVREMAATIIAKSIMSKPENAEIIHRAYAAENGKQEVLNDVQQLKFIASGYLRRKDLIKADGSVTIANVAEKILYNDSIQKAILKEYHSKKKAAESKKNINDILLDGSQNEKNPVNMINDINININTNANMAPTFDLNKEKNNIIE